MGSHPGKSKREKRTAHNEDTRDTTDNHKQEPQPKHAGKREQEKEASDSSEEEIEKMPLFRKKSKEPADNKKKLQHQIYLAKESPEPTFDVSGCELSDIPAGVFSLCKVLQKQALLAHNNWLTSLKGGGNLRDLANLRILDLHHNDLHSLPDDLHLISSLQVLNLEQNKLKSLPSSLAKLTALQTLNLKGNKFKSLPDCVCQLESLRTLDLSANPHLTHLPTELANCRALESLILDVPTMQYPPQAVCAEGTVAIMQFLCQESGRTYISPSKVLLSVLDPPNVVSPSISTHNMKPAEIVDLADMVEAYEQQKELKRRERMLLEQQLEEEQRQQAALATQAARNKHHLINYLSNEGARIDGELSALQQQKDRERQALIDTMQKAEESATLLTEQLTAANASARRTEELLELMEAERRATDQWWQVHAEEVQALRRSEVLAAMEQSLKEHNALMDASDRRRQITEQMLQERNDETDGRLNDFLSSQQDQQARFVQHLLKEEQVQKEAFESLQLQKDARHARLTGQIALIEQELAQLSRLELEERVLKVNTHMSMLEEKRSALTKLLVQLMEERSKREIELNKRLREMEERRVDTQNDYWLVQYQRLMDRKPTALMDEEKKLEFAVVDILERAGAAEYVPVFARHRITIETMSQLEEKDLQQMGVHELGLRKAIVREIKTYLQEEEEATAKAKKIESPDDWLVKGPVPDVAPPPVRTPTAPVVTPTAPLPSPSEPLPPPAAPLSPPPPAEGTPAVTPPEVTAHLTSECVICMEEQSCVLLLNCGHVCCCKKCSESVQECPLCRGSIVSRINVSGALQNQHLPQ